MDDELDFDELVRLAEQQTSVDLDPADEQAFLELERENAPAARVASTLRQPRNRFPARSSPRWCRCFRDRRSSIAPR